MFKAGCNQSPVQTLWVSCGVSLFEMMFVVVSEGYWIMSKRVVFCEKWHNRVDCEAVHARAKLEVFDRSAGFALKTLGNSRCVIGNI